MSKPRGLYLLHDDAFERIYGPDQQRDIAELIEIVAPQMNAEQVADDPSILADVDVIMSGWGMASMDEAWLAAAPNLKAVFYGAGSIRYFVTDASWNRGIMVCSAYAANAISVTEFTLAEVIFSLKRGWYFMRTVREDLAYPPRVGVPGAFGSTVGLVSLGMIGRMMAQRLQQLDVQVIAYDPFASSDDAAALGVELTSLEEIFQRSDVVSLHTPWLPETVGMITGKHFASMKPNSTFINTARGRRWTQQEMIDVLVQRPDLYAVLDVVYPEPPEPDSPLFSLPNVVLTPHIAGCVETECRRMGNTMVEELRRYLANEPMQWSITRERAAVMA